MMTLDAPVLLYHGSRGLAGKGAGLMITAVLCAGGQSFCTQQLADSAEMNKWRTQNDFLTFRG